MAAEQAMSQSPEGSSSHCNGRLKPRFHAPDAGLNHPKALLVTATQGFCVETGEQVFVSITRRLF